MPDHPSRRLPHRLLYHDLLSNPATQQRCPPSLLSSPLHPHPSRLPRSVSHRMVRWQRCRLPGRYLSLRGHGPLAPERATADESIPTPAPAPVPELPPASHPNADDAASSTPQPLAEDHPQGRLTSHEGAIWPTDMDTMATVAAMASWELDGNAADFLRVASMAGSTRSSGQQAAAKTRVGAGMVGCEVRWRAARRRREANGFNALDKSGFGRTSSRIVFTEQGQEGMGALAGPGYGPKTGNQTYPGCITEDWIGAGHPTKHYHKSHESIYFLQAW